MPKPAVVLDTNIFVRSFLGSPVHERIRNGFKNDLFQLILSTELFAEVIDVLNRPSLGFDLKETEKFLHLIKRKAVMVKVTTKIKACRDSSDDIVLEAAISAKADMIVTNDKDLLVLNPFRNIPILTPDQFLIELEVIP